MLIYGCIFSQIETALTIAATLSINSPFTVRSARDPEILKKRDNLMSHFGDLFTFLNVFR